MMRALALLSIAMVACGCMPTTAPVEGPETPDEIDPGNLEIDIGRNSVILDAIHDLAFQLPGSPSKYPESADVMNSTLRMVVWQYNGERELLCLRGYVPKQSCGAPYLPAWINETPSDAPSLATLDQRMVEISIRVEQLWDAACEEAKPRLKHEDWFPKCSIE